MKKCPNNKCRARSHATDAVYCHMCGTELVEEGIKSKPNPYPGNYVLGGSSSASSRNASGNVRSEDDETDYSTLFKWIIAIVVIVGVVALIVSFWEEILNFIGAVFFYNNCDFSIGIIELVIKSNF